MLPSGAGPISSISISKTSARSKQKPWRHLLLLSTSSLSSWLQCEMLNPYLASNHLFGCRLCCLDVLPKLRSIDVKAVKTKTAFGKHSCDSSDTNFYKLYRVLPNHSSWCGILSSDLCGQAGQGDSCTVTVIVFCKLEPNKVGQTRMPSRNFHSGHWELDTLHCMLPAFAENTRAGSTPFKSLPNETHALKSSNCT